MGTDKLKKKIIFSRFEFPNFIINTKQYYLSPTTIRYSKNSLNLLNFFSKKIFNSNIYKIGGGYGGEAKIFFDFASIYNKGKKIKWNIFDLPSSYNLIKKFLITQQLSYQLIKKLLFQKIL